MRVVVPFGAERPKTRLSSVLDGEERREFATAMLGDVLDALDASGHDPIVLTDAPLDWATATDDGTIAGADVVVDDRSLTAAVDDRLPDEDEDPVAVVMADLALATPDALDRLFASEADVVFAPGRGGGTNAIVVRHPDFRVDYHGASIRDHREIAAEVGATTATVDSFRLATDVDEPTDLVEVLLHTDGRAATWLRNAGFEVTTTDGRVEARRS
jgi:2-phospho-L-lactate guanylyltransferase